MNISLSVTLCLSVVDGITPPPQTAQSLLTVCDFTRTCTPFLTRTKVSPACCVLSPLCPGQLLRQLYKYLIKWAWGGGGGREDWELPSRVRFSSGWMDQRLWWGPPTLLLSQCSLQRRWGMWQVRRGTQAGGGQLCGVLNMI